MSKWVYDMLHKKLTDQQIFELSAHQVAAEFVAIWATKFAHGAAIHAIHKWQFNDEVLKKSEIYKSLREPQLAELFIGLKQIEEMKAGTKSYMELQGQKYETTRSVLG